MGDRVVFVSDASSVPIGTTGNIVGMFLDDEIDVLFDAEFFGGTTLNGRCSPGRGLRVKKDQLLNLTYPQPPYQDALHPPSTLHWLFSNPRPFLLE